VGDFNGDGKIDLAVVNGGSYLDYKGTVSVLLGKGDGTFQTQKTYAVGKRPVSVVVEDFNGDGKLDLAFSGYALTTLRGNGDGTFVAGNPSYSADAAYSLATGDFNGDGKFDLAVPDRFGNVVSIFINTTRPYPAASTAGAAIGPE
jgi:hypothetical protein